MVTHNVQTIVPPTQLLFQLMRMKGKVMEGFLDTEEKETVPIEKKACTCSYIGQVKFIISPTPNRCTANICDKRNYHSNAKNNSVAEI